MEIAKAAEAVIDGDHDDIAEARQGLAVVTGRAAGAAGKAAAMEEHHDGAFAGFEGRRPEVEDKTLLALAARLVHPLDQPDVIDTACGKRLRRDVPPLKGIADAAPFRGTGRWPWLRRLVCTAF